MCGVAPAPDTPTRAAAQIAAAVRAARLNTDRLSSACAQHSPEAFLQLDLGLPAEDLPGSRDVGLPDLRIVDGQRLEDDLAAAARHLQDELRELEQRELLGV